MKEKFPYNTKQKSGIFIIGSSDGPTSVFISNKKSYVLELLGLLAGVAAVAFGIFIFCRGKKRKITNKNNI